GNSCTDSLYQHVLRNGGSDRLLVAYNNFANPNVAGGVIKQTLNIHKGSYIYMAHNTLTDGDVRVGPLTSPSMLPQKAQRTSNVVFEDNIVNSPVNIDPGAEHVMVRDNIVKRDNAPAIIVAGYDKDFARGVADLTITDNTVINNGDHGMFLMLGGHAIAITLTHNLYVAPNFTAGSFGAAPVYVTDTSLDSFTTIADNVWPAVHGTGYTQGGMNFIGSKFTAAGYQTPTEWEAQAKVKNDKYQT